MTTQLFFTGSPATTHRSASDANLAGTATFWSALSLSVSRGVGVSSLTAATVAGTTNGIEVLSGTPPAEWISNPLSADTTISGTITLNLWANETAAANNVAANAIIEKIDGSTRALTQIAKTANTTEVATSSAVNNFTVAPTSTVCKKGDRLRVRIFADDAGTMGAGGTFTVAVGSVSAGVSGDSWIQFTETFTLITASAPAGTRYYLTDTAETINPGAAVEKKAATTRGAGSVNAVTNTAAGPTSGIQLTATGGGSAIEWYTPPLDAVTLGAAAQFNVRALESSATANASLRVEIAITAGDGTGAAVWCQALQQAATTNGERGELGVADAAFTIYPAGADTAVAAGQRLRFRIYVDDTGSAALVTGNTVTVSYNGTTAAAAGDTYVILPVTVTEQIAAAAKKPRVLSSSVAAIRAALR